MVKAILLKGQRGFTLIELMAVIAILTVLAGLVAGGVTGLGASGQAAKLDGDRNTIGKAANRFATDAFPEAYPSKRPPELMTSPDCCPTVGVIDFEATLPQDPTRKFVPKYLARIPGSAGLVSWRIDTATGKVFPADEAALLVLPSTNELEVSPVTPGLPGSTATQTTSVNAVSDYRLRLRMKKNEAAVKVLKVEIPAGYGIGGASIPSGTAVGNLRGTFATDNPWRPGQEINYTGTLRTTSKSHEWDLVVNYDANNLNADVKNTGSSTRTHKVQITTPTTEVGGQMVLTMDRGTDPDHNEATERFRLRLFGDVGGTTIITNPSVKKVYRWLAEEHTAIDPSAGGKDVFNAVAGNQAVVVQGQAVKTIILHFDELPFQPINGLSIAGVTFLFSIGGTPSTDARYGAGGPGSVTFVQDPSLEGNAFGTLTIDFAVPTNLVQFGIARSCFCTLSAGAIVDVFAPSGELRGSFNVSTNPIMTFSEGLFTFNGPDVKKVVINFGSPGSASRFAIDNLDPPLPTETLPKASPGSALPARW